MGWTKLTGKTFNPNRDSLKEAILELFYEKKK